MFRYDDDGQHVNESCHGYKQQQSIQYVYGNAAGSTATAATTTTYQYLVHQFVAVSSEK